MSRVIGRMMIAIKLFADEERTITPVNYFELVESHYGLTFYRARLQAFQSALTQKLCKALYITGHEYPGCNTNETEDCTVINEDLQENELQDEDHTEPLQPTTPESVRPYPKAVFKKKKNLRKKVKSTVYTRTPEKRRIEDMEKNKLIEAKKGERKKRKILCSKKESEILTKKDVCISSDSESDISKQEDRASELEETRILKPIADTDLIGINDFVLVKFL
ncbi:hypothetical protein AVEN_136490-1 [Araneus ventricosus]|uniref:Uncharacterized protein n=1 Tax=Araneus ventricosus TaxID=182803 RepID=A0A4Y2Q1N3_ARAVE|nr:hypothetical protein AVEN_136490-1 [Araneus ventricosus]